MKKLMMMVVLIVFCFSASAAGIPQQDPARQDTTKGPVKKKTGSKKPMKKDWPKKDTTDNKRDTITRR
ncbi:hypothetical protein [Pseudopedobacter sp.]|uniref:hypothetical protein n=1 Tax=Pseudopedobacter sp. TaxID=1936787 RepID=UPI00333EAD0B